MKTITTWKTKLEFESRHEHSTIAIDGNKTNGFGPKALLLAGLAGCSGVDIVEILEKMRINFSEFAITAETVQTEEHPRVFKDIHLTYSMKTNPENEEKVRKAIELSLNKYCGVSAMLKKNSPIHYQLVIL